MGKLTKEIRDFIDTEIRGKRGLSYSRLIKVVAEKYGVRVSKSTISKRGRALRLESRRGRRRFIPPGKQPAHSSFFDGAGAIFLKGAELELGLLPAINRLLQTTSDSAQARKALRLAQQINGLLLYAPVFGLRTAEDIAGYQRRGLLYLTAQKDMPGRLEIEQYLRYLVDQKLLPLAIKEVARICLEVLLVRIDFAGQTFYLDAQGRTVWPTLKVPKHFTTTINKTKSYIKSIFQSPAGQQPLILQTAPGYTFLPPEAFNLIHCFEQAKDRPISRIVAMGKFGETLAFWSDLKTGRKLHFIFPLSPWQYGRLHGTQIVKGFRQYRIGPNKEAMSVADARINLFNPQLHTSIGLRAAMVRRANERLALVTNISWREERYIRRIAEQYFTRWPDATIKTYYDLLEGAHQEVLSRSQGKMYVTPLLTTSYSQQPQDAFRLFLEHLHRYALGHFFPTEYEAEDLKAMCEKFYRQSGYLRIKQHCWEVFLQPFPQKNLQKACQVACQRFNQSNIQFPAQKSLRIYQQ